MGNVPAVAAAVLVAIAAAIDIRTRRVPNVLTFGASGTALIYFLVTGGLRGLGTSALGWTAGVALFLPLFLLRGLGAGDVKLLGAVGAWLGPMGAVRSGFLTVFAGGVLALAVAVRHRYLREAFSNLGGMLWSWRLQGPRPVAGMTLEDSKGPRLPYAAAIAAGTLAALWLS